MKETYRERFYRGWCAPEGLVRFRVCIKESDLLLAARRDLSAEARRELARARGELERYIERDPGFARALAPYRPRGRAPAVARRMARAAAACGVGPMAAVAGALAEEVGRALLSRTPEVIVENGGDVFALLQRPLLLALYAGRQGPLLPVELAAPREGAGVASSSARIGPSLSFGRAELAMVAARDAALADAAATALGNRIRTPRDLAPALRWVLGIEGVLGAAAVCGGRTALAGPALRIPEGEPGSVGAGAG